MTRGTDSCRITRRILVAAHPVRERLVAALMRALVAAGRDTEALLVYQRTREALADALGVDPSPELSALHVALLRGESGRREETRMTGDTPGRLTSGGARQWMPPPRVQLCVFPLAGQARRYRPHARDDPAARRLSQPCSHTSGLPRSACNFPASLHMCRTPCSRTAQGVKSSSLVSTRSTAAISVRTWSRRCGAPPCSRWQR
jgi:Bacterial transcriptional activator domain